MTNLKKAVSALLIAGTLATATATPAKAGIIFSPVGIGIVMLVVGLVYGDPLLIILDADGSPSLDSLQKSLAAKYPQIDDSDVTTALASRIREKAASVEADAEGKKHIALSREELSEILAPTGLEESDPAVFEQIVRDME